MPSLRDLDPKSRHALRELAREVKAKRSLAAFCERYDPNYMQPAHVRLLVDHLEALEAGTLGTMGLIVEMPPRHSKTYHVSQRFPAWYLGRNPDKHVILASYASGLANTNSRVVRNIIRDERWPWDKIHVAADKGQVEQWETNLGGGVLAVGVGGGATGHGADFLDIDDPIKDRKEADSELLREQLWAWFTEVASTRLHPGAIVLITMTRWHEDDLVGRILADEDMARDYTRLRLPALAEPGDILGRQPGQALWPERYPVERLNKLMRPMSPRGRSAIYQQAPTPGEGGTFKLDWLDGRWDQLPPEACKKPAGCTGLGRCDHTTRRRTAYERGFDENPIHTPSAWGMPENDRWQTFMFIDTAKKANISSDFSAIAVWGFDGRSYYLLDGWHGQEEYVVVRDKAKAMWGLWRCPLVVEQQARGLALITDLHYNTRIPVIPFDPDASKEIRADSVTPYFEAGHVLLPRNRAWLQDWIDEHIAFPNGAHDDWVDTTSMALLRMGIEGLLDAGDFDPGASEAV